MGTEGAVYRSSSGSIAEVSTAPAPSAPGAAALPLRPRRHAVRVPDTSYRAWAKRGPDVSEGTVNAEVGARLTSAARFRFPASADLPLRVEWPWPPVRFLLTASRRCARRSPGGWAPSSARATATRGSRSRSRSCAGRTPTTSSASPARRPSSPASATRASSATSRTASPRAGEHYLAMEWLEGEDLGRARLAAAGSPMAESLAIVRRAAEALAFAHARGLVHRDLKPSQPLPRAAATWSGSSWSTSASPGSAATRAAAHPHRRAAGHPGVHGARADPGAARVRSARRRLRARLRALRVPHRPPRLRGDERHERARQDPPPGGAARPGRAPRHPRPRSTIWWRA